MINIKIIYIYYILDSNKMNFAFFKNASTDKKDTDDFDEIYQFHQYDYLQLMLIGLVNIIIYQTF